jgi:hypothetical protein
MKKRIVSLAFFSIFLIAESANADISENFKSAGISLSGSATVNFNPGYFLKTGNAYQYLSASLSPSFGRNVVDNVELYISPSFYYSSEQTSLSNVNNTISIGMGAGLGVYLSEGASGPGSMVPYLGVDASVTYYPAANDIVSGTVSTSKYTYLWWSVYPRIATYYFLTERIALKVGASLQISTWSVLTDAYGDSYQDTSVLTDKLWLGTSTYIGITFFLPSKDRTLFMQE